MISGSHGVTLSVFFKIESIAEHIEHYLFRYTCLVESKYCTVEFTFENDTGAGKDAIPLAVNVVARHQV